MNFVAPPPKLLTEAEVTEIIDDVMLYSKDARTGAHRGAREARAGTRGP